MTTPKYSLTHLGGHKWRVKVSMGRAPDGGYRQKSKTFEARTKREAKDRAADWSAMVRAGSDQGTFGAMCEAWYLAKSGELKPSTLRGYRTKLDKHILPVLGRVDLLDMDRATVAAWVDGLKVAQRTKNQLVSMVRSASRWAHIRGRVTSIDYLAPLQTSEAGLDKTEAPDSADIQRLLIHLAGPAGDPLVYAVVFLASTTGARRGELLGLTVADVNLEVGSMRIARSIDRTGPVIPKTVASRRVIALSGPTIGVLERHLLGLRDFYRVATGDPAFELDPGQWLFPSPANPERHWYPEAISKAVKRHVLLAGMPQGAVMLHRLRNYSITELADAGVPSKVIAERHGHARIAVTEGVYMGRLSVQDKLAAEIIGRSIGELLPPSG